jgi:hypothetical protein
MSIYKDRMYRMMYKDIFLPFVCYATRNTFYSREGFCKCLTHCKFMGSRGELRQIRGSQNSEQGKDRE